MWADRGGSPTGPLWRTTDWGYLRLHEGTAQPWPRYRRAELRAWEKRLSAEWAGGQDVYVYFNNDPGGAAIYDAVAFGADRPGGGTPTGPRLRPPGAGPLGRPPGQGPPLVRPAAGRVRTAVAAGQPALHAGQQFLGVDRLGHVVAGARVEALLPVALHGPRGHRDDGQAGEAGHLADGRHRRVAVHLRHHHVHQDEVDALVGVQDADALAAVRRAQHGDPVRLQ